MRRDASTATQRARPAQSQRLSMCICWNTQCRHVPHNSNASQSNSTRLYCKDAPGAGASAYRRRRQCSSALPNGINRSHVTSCTARHGAARHGAARHGAARHGNAINACPHRMACTRARIPCARIRRRTAASRRAVQALRSSVRYLSASHRRDRLGLLVCWRISACRCATETVCDLVVLGVASCTLSLSCFVPVLF